MKIRTIRPTAKIKRKRKPVKLKASATRAASRRQAVDDYDEEEEFYEPSEPNMKLSHAFIVVLILHLIAVAGIFGFNTMKNRQNTLSRIAEETSAVSAAEAAAADATAEAAGRAAAAAAAGRSTESTAPASSASVASTAASASPRTHQVVPGDTLFRLSSQYGTTIEAIEVANNMTSESVLRVGQILQIPAPGAEPAAAQQVTASTPASSSTTATTPNTSPAPSTASTAAASTSQPSAPASSASSSAAATESSASTGGEAKVYEVVAGDNPYSIARRLNVSYQALIDLNNITDPTKLQIGQKLKIPSSQ